MRLEVISRIPKGAKRGTPLLFVHGAWHAAWCWERHFLDYFADRGWEAHALSLRGHGNSEGHERIRRMRLDEFVEDVSQVAEGFAHPPILIGHSMGGGIIQKYLEKRAAPAGVLMASMPPSGILATAMRLLWRHPLIFARMNVSLSLYPMVEKPEYVREWFLSEAMPNEDVWRYAELMQEESYRAFLDMLLLNLPKPSLVSTPLLVLGAEKDALFSPAQVKATAKAYGTQAVIFDDMAHDMMLECEWSTVGDTILDWLTDKSA